MYYVLQNKEWKMPYITKFWWGGILMDTHSSIVGWRKILWMVRIFHHRYTCKNTVMLFANKNFEKFNLTTGYLTGNHQKHSISTIKILHYALLGQMAKYLKRYSKKRLITFSYSQKCLFLVKNYWWLIAIFNSVIIAS